MPPPGTQRLGPFPVGMDNRAPDFDLALPQDAGHRLRDALNVDVTTEGSIKTRAGYTQVVAGDDVHSLWAPLEGSFALYCGAGNLYRTTPAMAPVLVAPGFGQMGPVRYVQVNEAIYFTDGVRAGSYHPSAGPTPAWGNAVAQTVGDQDLVPMPPGSNLAYHNARLLVAVGSALIYSEPFTPHLRDAARGFELFPAQITCVAAVEAGVFVVADKTYFIEGGFPAQTVRAVLPYGGPSQQAGYRPDGGAHWMSTRGIVACSKDGEITNLQDKHIAIEVSGAAATLMREADGTRAIVAALTEQGSFAAGIGTWAQARIIRKGQT